MSWLAGLKCGDERCGCTGNPPRSDWNPTGPYAGMGLDLSGPGQMITSTLGYKVVRVATNEELKP